VRARLYLDEDILPELARVLRAVGYDVSGAHEAGTHGWDDEAQLAHAASQGRALLSCNYPDFLRIGRQWFFSGRPHAGIIVSYRQYSRRELRDLRRAALRLLETVSAEQLRDSIYVLDAYRAD
jgi:uncharacterized protein with PIN domain